MYISKLRSKIHLVTVTDTHPDYEGSITICKELMERANLSPYDMVHVNNHKTGAHWETYVIEGEPGVICMNGAAAHHFSTGDQVHILAYAMYEGNELYIPIVVYCDKDNKVIKKDMHRPVKGIKAGSFNKKMIMEMLQQYKRSTATYKKNPYNLNG